MYGTCFIYIVLSLDFGYTNQNHEVSSLVQLYKSDDWNNDAKRKEIAKYIESTCLLSLHVDSDK